MKFGIIEGCMYPKIINDNFSCWWLEIWLCLIPFKFFGYRISRKIGLERNGNGNEIRNGSTRLLLAWVNYENSYPISIIFEKNFMNLENLFDKFTSSVMGWKILVEGVKIRLEHRVANQIVCDIIPININIVTNLISESGKFIVSIVVSNWFSARRKCV